MPCYLNTIIKIKHVKQNETKDAKSISVWAIGTYPIGLEDNEIEVVLYVPRNRDERDPNSQAMFRKDEYYLVGGRIIPNRYTGTVRPKMSVATSTHLTITSRTSDSNKCPLKVSLIGTAQGNPTAIENTDDSIIEMLLTDYVTQDHEFTIYVVFSHTNPRFEYLKINTQLKDSTIFVVGQMEVINNKFYVNAKDFNYFNIKKKNSDTVSLQIQPTSANPTRTRLLQIHQNITKNLKEAPVIQTPSLTTSSDIESESSVKRKRSEEIDQLIDDKPKKPIKKPKSLKNSTRSPIKERPIRTTRGPKKSHHTTVEDAESDKE